MNYEEEIKKIQVKMVKELREKTGVGMMDCKKALQLNEWDEDAAIEFLINVYNGVRTYHRDYFGEARKKQIEEINKKYEEDIVKQIISYAVTTEDFNEKGCYIKEFVKVGDKEVTLMVMDDSWVATRKDAYYDLVGSRDHHKMNKFSMGLY